jgi:hypothetical protein
MEQPAMPLSVDAKESTKGSCPRFAFYLFGGGHTALFPIFPEGNSAGKTDGLGPPVLMALSCNTDTPYVSIRVGLIFLILGNKTIQPPYTSYRRTAFSTACDFLGEKALFASSAISCPSRSISKKP